MTASAASPVNVDCIEAQRDAETSNDTSLAPLAPFRKLMFECDKLHAELYLVLMGNHLKRTIEGLTESATDLTRRISELLSEPSFTVPPLPAEPYQKFLRVFDYVLRDRKRLSTAYRKALLEDVTRFQAFPLDLPEEAKTYFLNHKGFAGLLSIMILGHAAPIYAVSGNDLARAFHQKSAVFVQPHVRVMMDNGWLATLALSRHLPDNLVVPLSTRAQEQFWIGDADA